MPPMMRPALAASLMALSVVLLAGCGQPQPAPSDAPPAAPAPVDTPLSQAPIDATPIKPEPAPVPAAPKPKPEPVVAEPAAEPAGEPGSCLAEIGAARSKRLVERCIKVSPATHPPCNSANPCAMIQDEIDRSCAMYGPDEAKPKECAAYLIAQLKQHATVVARRCAFSSSFSSFPFSSSFLFFFLPLSFLALFWAAINRSSRRTPGSSALAEGTEIDRQASSFVSAAEREALTGSRRPPG